VSIVGGQDAGRSTTSGIRGVYVLSGLHESTLTVRVSDTNHVAYSQVVNLTSDLNLDFSLEPTFPHIVLTGVVTDALTSAPIQDAVVYINGRYHTSTHNTGFYTLSGYLDFPPGYSFTFISADGYVTDYRYIRGVVQNARLRRITRIAAGDSMVVTVEPDDTLCVNNVQDFPGFGLVYVCGNVRVTIPANGILTVQGLASVDGIVPGLEVEIPNPNGPCCSERLENPTSIAVKAGDEVTVNVEMPSTLTTSQSFKVMTTFRSQ
jgi:hypothetical protein